jgi:HEAT repeat protein
MSSHERSALHDEEAIQTARRRGRVADAGHRGDEATARDALSDPDPGVRASALAALVRMGTESESDLDAAIADPTPAVRRRAAELATRSLRHGAGAGALLLRRLADGSEKDAGVVEAVCYSLGELQPPGATEVLARIASAHTDPLCRESAVAALGAIGDESALATILGCLDDRPPVRRRAVLALAPYDGPEVDAALARALEDKDWQVRQAAEDLSGNR